MYRPAAMMGEPMGCPPLASWCHSRSASTTCQGCLVSSWRRSQTWHPVCKASLVGKCAVYIYLHRIFLCTNTRRFMHHFLAEIQIRVDNISGAVQNEPRQLIHQTLIACSAPSRHEPASHFPWISNPALPPQEPLQAPYDPAALP